MLHCRWWLPKASKIYDMYSSMQTALLLPEEHRITSTQPLTAWNLMAVLC
ncbi:hypothetical protein [Halodesulfovibrio sp.]|jgi:hypothetical protein|nr:hypothetical protein [Halodesulfovibrio sp.]MCT4627606.1 hypothetical protein [Halodesulfovibrio sp.]